MNRKTFWILDLAVLFALQGNALGYANSTQAAWPPLQPESEAAEVQPGKAPIDPNVYISLERQGTAQVLVFLQQQADLSGASQLQTKIEKGAFVYEQLTTIARQTQGPLRAFLDSQGVEYRAYWIINMLMVAVDVTLLNDLAGQPGVERIEMYAQSYVEPLGHDLGTDYGAEFGPIPPAMTTTQSGRNLGTYGTKFGPLSPTTVEWNIQRVGAPDVWAMGITGAGAVVGVLDTGVEWTHPALVNHYRLQIPGAPGRHDYNWYDGVGGSALPIDYGFHGTMSMGPIVGDDGGQNQIGMAPGANWIACAGAGSPYVNPLDCYQWFLAPTKLDGTDPRPDLAPDVINQIEPSPKDYHAVVQALYAAGIYIVQPAGNNGPECSTLDLPMNQYPEVTATGAFKINDDIWEYSSRGPALVGHESLVKPDITAPGVDIRSSVPQRWGLYFDGLSGTSLAAPHVAGGVALLISAVPELRGRVDLIDMLLKTNAEPRASSECTPGGGVPNNVWGWGMLNVYNAVLAAQALELGALEGQVVDAGTLEPIEGVKLTFADTTLGWPYPDRSDSLGQYDHTLPVGTYVITATQYGYLDSVISGVEISPGVTTTQDIEMSLAPTWNVSGVVTDSQTGEPLAASIALEGTPASTESDPETGAYSVAAAQGDWWLVVTSPGYAEKAIKITLDQDLLQNFSLDPIFNYSMRRSVDGECGPQFDWVDATDGTEWPITWLDLQYVGLPPGGTFTFYGNTYNGIYINSHGIVTFEPGFTDMGSSIPDPAKPNNAIYAFSTFLNPGEDFEGGGNIYTKYVDSRYFVIEWHEVVHWVNRDPETFEIILDLFTNRIKLQYLIVSNATGVLAGVENSTGSEATLYAYDDPGMFTNNTAVEFYPWFGPPPPSGGAGEMLGVVTDAYTDLPIEGALVTAEAYTTVETFTFTTGLTGAYSASLCADWYDVMAEASGYEPSVKVRASVYSGTQTIQDFVLTPQIAPTAITITGTAEGWIYTPYIFTAAVEPITTTLPLDYVWQASGQLPITHTGGLTDTVGWAWEMPGTQVITVTATNPFGSVSDSHVITIAAPLYEIYLPLVSKASEAPLTPGFHPMGGGVLLGLVIVGMVSWWERRG